MVTPEVCGFIKLQPFTISRTPFLLHSCAKRENRTDWQVAREYINIMKRLILASLLAVFAASGALGQQIIVTVPGGHDREWYEHHGYVWHDGQWYRGEPGGHDREWYEHHGYVWHDGQWYRGEGHHHHDGYWKDGHYYRYDEDRD
jgi:hypothetical protein